MATWITAQGSVTADNGATPSNAGGKGWRWMEDNAGTVIDTANDLLCLINPKRYGCYPPPGQQYPYQAQSSNTVLYIALAVIIIILFILALRK